MLSILTIVCRFVLKVSLHVSLMWTNMSSIDIAWYGNPDRHFSQFWPLVGSRSISLILQTSLKFTLPKSIDTLIHKIAVTWNKFDTLRKSTPSTINKSRLLARLECP